VIGAVAVGALALPWRVGRSLGHTVYAQIGPMPSDADAFLFTTHPDAALAEHVVALHNAALARAARA
jgi:hypothetical protein